MENESLKPKMGGTKIFALRVARPVASLAMLLGVILIFAFSILFRPLPSPSLPIFSQ